MIPTMIESTTDLEREMYKLVCMVDDGISDDEIYDCLKSAIANANAGVIP